MAVETTIRLVPISRPDTSLQEFTKASGSQIHSAPHEQLEHHLNDPESRSAQSLRERSGDTVTTRKQDMLEKIQYLGCCSALFLAGWNDGSTGPLIPRIRTVYNVGFTVVSLIFIFACLGFFIGAFSNVWLNEKIGFGKTLALGSMLQVIAYALQAPALPFPVFVMAYTINGIGIAVQDAQANAYVAGLKKNAALKMGILHAVYGVGALCSPFVATQFAELPRWSFYFLVSEGIALINMVLILVIFRGRSQNECLTNIGQEPVESDNSEHSKFRQIMFSKETQLLAFFVLVYVGIEVTIGGWIVTFVQDIRNGVPSAGYVSAGFFGGLALGRVSLLWLNKLVGERRVLFVYAILAIGLELVVWLVPSLLGSAISVSFVGVLLGPLYPIAINHSSRILPQWLLTGSIGYIAGFGAAGSAVFPFMTGALSGKFGIQSLQPLLIGMIIFMDITKAHVPTDVTLGSNTQQASSAIRLDESKTVENALNVRLDDQQFMQ